MRYLLWGIVLTAAIYYLHRIAVWADKQGWIYCRGHHASSGTLGNAFLEMQKIFEPSKRHIIEERIKKAGEGQTAGDKPEAGHPKSDKDRKA